MEEIKCITFDKAAQDNLPQEIKDKMKADREKAEAKDYLTSHYPTTKDADWDNDYLPLNHILDLMVGFKKEVNQEQPTEEHIKTVAQNKALKYDYANGDNYDQYVKAITEGANFVKKFKQ